TSRPPSRYPISRRFGFSRNSITVTAASRVAFAAATSEYRKILPIGASALSRLRRCQRRPSAHPRKEPTARSTPRKHCCFSSRAEAWLRRIELPQVRESPNRKGIRMADRPVFLYAAIYDDIDDAEADYEAVFDLHAAGAIGTFDSAVIRKEDDGKVRVTKTEKPTQHGAWTGAGVGALVGILFPPSIIGTAIVGAGAGGLIGHLRGGIPRDDLKDLGEELEQGNAAVIVLGESKIEEQLEKAVTRANKLIEKQVDADADELKREIDAAAKEDAA